MKTITIGGVPEHFNLPWYLTLRNKEYQEKGINLRWKDFSGGTGQMNKALRSGEIDMAVILTEGIIRDIIKGNPSSIVQVFVKSPLIWGIHVADTAPYTNVEDLRGTHAAISRFGSGSHLMAYVHAEDKGWDMEKDLKFKVIGDLEGALEGLPKGQGDYFMWEKFTTKPYVDDGPFRILGECPTPWPCFVIAVRNEFIASHGEAVRDILEIINRTTSDFKNIPGIATMISNRYGQQLQDVEEWLDLTEWSQENLTELQVDRIQSQLLKLDLIKNKMLSKSILHNF
ncbi:MULTISPECIES: substrate-binding domain-containing protein [Altibacter]|uniref:substrate-binding domain-containing protein n=1 Tax=Altibacter TaxID=1535231 RepID=UPI000552F0BC|nr:MULTISPECIES: substrate-binding domain-containing protein [Altibacter]MCW8980428.1 substrate-binding domain-containing protein [Altibacter sp.]MCW9037447.1 substrate-binding domain-containing protein [Altibacter sp.]